MMVNTDIAAIQLLRFLMDACADDVQKFSEQTGKEVTAMLSDLSRVRMPSQDESDNKVKLRLQLKCLEEGNSMFAELRLRDVVLCTDAGQVVISYEDGACRVCERVKSKATYAFSKRDAADRSKATPLQFALPSLSSPLELLLFQYRSSGVRSDDDIEELLHGNRHKPKKPIATPSPTRSKRGSPHSKRIDPLSQTLPLPTRLSNVTPGSDGNTGYDGVMEIPTSRTTK